MIDAGVIIEQIDEILARAGIAAEQQVGARAFDEMSSGELAALCAAWSAAIVRLTQPGSRYRDILDGLPTAYGEGSGYPLATELAGMLQALRRDVAAGYTTSIVELIHADMFTDFIEMARELLDSGYKDAAAVIVGAALEQDLRQLCVKNQLPTDDRGAPRSAGRMNDQLKAADAYQNLDHKNVIAWLDLRNKAAHGDFESYGPEQVAIMLAGVREFITRLPA